MCFCVRSFSTSFCTATGCTTVSATPWMKMPDAGQGARKLKSYMFAGGAMEMKPRISGRRISNCMPISAPKLTPAIQVVCASGWIDCTQSSAAAASESSPMPLSKLPWLRPTPRKLKRNVAKPRSTNVLYSRWTMRSFIVPPPCECGWRIIATGARGRGGGAKRPSRRPSGPGKITEGMVRALTFGLGARLAPEKLAAI